MTAIGEIKTFSQEELLPCVPALRSFARSLTRNRDQADDLVQDTIARAIVASHRFQPGTNLKAWMFTILRNLYLSEMRKSHRFVQWDPNNNLHEKAVPPSQERGLEFSEFRQALSQIDKIRSKALILVGVDGVSYENAAKILNCPIGTVKSRVSRARQIFRHILEEGTPNAGHPAFSMLASNTHHPVTQAPI